MTPEECSSGVLFHHGDAETPRRTEESVSPWAASVGSAGRRRLRAKGAARAHTSANDKNQSAGMFLSVVAGVFSRAGREAASEDDAHAVPP